MDASSNQTSKTDRNVGKLGTGTNFLKLVPVPNFPVLSVVVVLAVAIFPAVADDVLPAAKSPIVVEADRLDVEEEGARVRAEGGVVVEWDTSKLTAEAIDVDQRERRVEASGAVTYRSDDLSGTASRALLDVDSETGLLEDVELRLQGEAGHFGGKRIEKVEGRRLLIEEGYFTTCVTDAGHEPDWELEGDTLDVRMDDYARLRGGRLSLRGVPVLYVPYIVFPTKQTRQSGLLSPAFASSNRRGFVYSQPGFWAIDKQQDATVTGVVETGARLGLDVEYRYAPSRRRFGSAHLAYYNETVRGDAESEIDSPLFLGSDIPLDRGIAEVTHRELGDDWTMYADLQLVSDDVFLREVDPLTGNAPDRDLLRSHRYTTSRAGALATRGFTSGGIEMVGYQNLVDSRRYTLQEPAEAWVRSDGDLGPLAYGIESSLSSFAREAGSDGERFDVAADLGVPLWSGERLRSRAWASGRGNAYYLTERDELDDTGAFVRRLDQAPTRGYFEGGVDLRSKLARTYALANSERWANLYHTLEPFTAMRYANRSSYDEIPLFDRLDALDGRDVASYGLESRFLLLGRQRGDEENEGPYELARISLMQSYNTSRDVVDDHFSDIDLAAFVQPVQGLALRALTSYNVGTSELRGAHASLSWRTGPLGPILRGRNSEVAAAYRFVRSDATDLLESAELLARLAFTPNVSLGLKGRYDVIGKSLVERAAGLTFSASCECWSLGVGVVQNIHPDKFSVPDELEVRLAFELAGLGGLGSGATQRTSPALDDLAYEDLGFWRAGW